MLAHHYPVGSLYGGAGNDTLLGGEHGDTLDGGSGNDTLIGHADGTIFFGQAGEDLFVYHGGQSWVMDFDPILDDLNFQGRTLREATQAGDHVRLSFHDGDLYLAWTQLARASLSEFDDLLL